MTDKPKDTHALPQATLPPVTLPPQAVQHAAPPQTHPPVTPLPTPILSELVEFNKDRTIRVAETVYADKPEQKIFSIERSFRDSQVGLNNLGTDERMNKAVAQAVEAGLHDNFKEAEKLTTKFAEDMAKSHGAGKGKGGR